MLYRSLTLSFVNKAVQNVLKNFGLWLVINSLGRPQTIKSKYLRKARAYYLADQVSIFSMRVICFENLQVTDMSALNLSTLTERARMISKVKIKKGTGGDSMG